MDLNTDIQSAIQAHLPAAVGEQLRKRLTQADAADKDNSSLKARIEVLEVALKAKDAELAKHKSMAEREATCAGQEAANASKQRDLETRENALAATVALTREEAANRERDSIFKLAEIALGKRAFTERHSRHVGKDVPYQAPGSSYMSTQHVNESETTERSIEEIG